MNEGHEIKGFNSENKNRFSNATSKFHGRSGQARVNSQNNPNAGRNCVALSITMLESVHKTCLRGLCNQVKAKSVAMRQGSHAKTPRYSREV